MKTIVLLLASVSAALAVSNSVTLTELNGASVSQVQVISRVFKKAEFPSGTYPQPQTSGTNIVPYQVDTKNTWPDGSLRHALITIPITLSSHASQVVTFVPSIYPCNNGTIYLDRTACDAAGLDASGMLAFNGGNWNGAIVTSVAGLTDHSIDARTMIAAGKYVYWQRGPVITTAIVEDRSTARAYDWAYTCLTNCTLNDRYETSTWGIDSTHKTLHPIFVLQFPASWAGVRIEYILENAWTDGLQDQRYSVTLKSGASLGTTKYTVSDVTNFARTRWRKTFWDGAAPAVLKTDLNLPYMIDSRILPNYDLSVPVSTAAVTAEVANYNGNLEGKEPLDCPAPDNYCGSYLKATNSTGGRPEIGPLQRWDMVYLYTWNPAVLPVVFGNADIAGNVPTHLREGATTKFFDGAHTVGAFGRWISVDARPTWTVTSLSSSDTVTADKVVPVAPLSTYALSPGVPPGSPTRGWYFETGPDPSHSPSLAFVGYLISGDWYLGDEISSRSHWEIACGNPKAGNNYGHHDSWGLLNYQANNRAIGWASRNELFDIVMTPDPAEYTYMLEKYTFQAAAWEGWHNITAGNFNGNAQWTWGHNVMQNGPGNGPGLVNANVLHFQGGEASIVSPVDSATTLLEFSPWMDNFIRISLMWADEMGYSQWHYVREAMAKNLINQALNPQFNHFLMDTYRMPSVAKSNSGWFQTWADVLLGYQAAARTQSAWSSTYSFGYTQIMLAGLSGITPFSDGALTGVDAWTLAYTSVPRAGLADDPRFALLPRNITFNCTITTADPLPGGTIGVAYSTTLAQSGCSGAVTWTVTSGALCAGLSLGSSTGTISGTPLVGGPCSFIVTATDSGSNVGTKSLSIDVPVIPGLTFRGITVRGLTGR